MHDQGTLHKLGAWGRPLWRSSSISAETIRMSMNKEEEGEGEGRKEGYWEIYLHYLHKNPMVSATDPISELKKLTRSEITVLKLHCQGMVLLRFQTCLTLESPPGTISQAGPLSTATSCLNCYLPRVIKEALDTCHSLSIFSPKRCAKMPTLTTKTRKTIKKKKKSTLVIGYFIHLEKVRGFQEKGCYLKSEMMLKTSFIPC